MNSKSVEYWMNNLEGNNKKQPRSKESEIACQVAEFYVMREKEKRAA
jgi:hypothetical protein